TTRCACCPSHRSSGPWPRSWTGPPEPAPGPRHRRLRAGRADGDRWLPVPAVASVALTGIAALPAALADERPITAQFAAERVVQRLLVAAEIEYRADDQQPSGQVDLGAGLAMRAGAGGPGVVHRVAQVLLFGHPAPRELCAGAAAPPQRGLPGV